MAPKPDPDPEAITRAETLAFELAEFSGRAGHDLLGPLGQASSLLTMFLQRYENHPDPQAHLLLDFLQNATVKMQGVVAGVQSYLNIAAAAPGFSQVDMSAALASARMRLESAIAGSSAVILADTLPIVSADRGHMVEIFEILIGNAIKFRSVEPPRIRISARQSGDHWLFSVEDNGIGINAEHREAVFLPFRRLHGKAYPGAGLGLAAAKLIVGLRGGRIWIEPAKAAEGITVLFTAPVSQ